MENSGKSPFLIGNTSSKGPFSIAMLDYRSVTVVGARLECFGPGPTGSSLSATFLTSHEFLKWPFQLDDSKNHYLI